MLIEVLNHIISIKAAIGGFEACDESLVEWLQL